MEIKGGLHPHVRSPGSFLLSVGFYHLRSNTAGHLSYRSVLVVVENVSELIVKDVINSVELFVILDSFKN